MRIPSVFSANAPFLKQVANIPSQLLLYIKKVVQVTRDFFANLKGKIFGIPKKPISLTSASLATKSSAQMPSLPSKNSFQIPLKKEPLPELPEFMLPPHQKIEETADFRPFERFTDPLDRAQIIQELEDALKYGRSVSNKTLKELDVRDFLEVAKKLADKSRLADFAIQWAYSIEKKPDPNHPFYEIFEEVFKNKELTDSNPRLTLETYTRPAGYGYGSSRLEYILETIVGFQELGRKETFELIAQFPADKGYNFADSLAGIVMHKNETNDLDVLPKLSHGLGAFWGAYQLAKKKGKLDVFIKHFVSPEGHQPTCFEGRTARFCDCTESLLDETIATDFYADIKQHHRTEEKVAKHLEAFRNQLIWRFSKAHENQGLTYKKLKDFVIRGEAPSPFQNLYSTFLKYYTKNEFFKYLERYDHPIRERAPVVYSYQTKNTKQIHLAWAERYKPCLILKKSDPRIQDLNLTQGESLFFDSTWGGIFGKVKKIDDTWVTFDLRGQPVSRELLSYYLDQQGHDLT